MYVCEGKGDKQAKKGDKRATRIEKDKRRIEGGTLSEDSEAQKFISAGYIGALSRRCLDRG